MLPADSPLLAGLNDAQAKAVTSEADSLLIVAGAGSGKTSVLTRRIAACNPPPAWTILQRKRSVMLSWCEKSIPPFS